VLRLRVRNPVGKRPSVEDACTLDPGYGIYSSRMAQGRTRDELEDRIDAAMDRCANGDDAAFGEVYELMGPKLISFFLRQGATQELAEDLLQDVAVRLYRARGNFQRGASAMAWAYGVSRNAYIDHLRAAKTRRVVVSDDDALGRVASDESTSAEAMVSAGQQAEHLAAALEKLPPAQRQAYELRHVHGLEVSDAAAEAGVTENAFKIRVHRAKEALRHALHLLLSDDER
jgi:RNA polymerase sigma-70 factor, ECF subfamily